MASSKSFFLLICAVLAFVLIVSAEASTSQVESENTDEVEDQYGGGGHPEGASPVQRCRFGCCRRHCHCIRCCPRPKNPRELLDVQFEDDTGN